MKKKKAVKITVYILLAFLLIGGTYGFIVYQSLKSAVKTMHEPIERETIKRSDPVTFKEKDPFSVLLLGTDSTGEKGRTDTIIVLTVNPNTDSVHMLSIPRDTRTEIMGLGYEDKINHAHAFGGVEMAMDTVENFLDIPIDYYMKINMEGFKDIVDAVGGVTVTNTLDFSVGNTHFPVGEITLNGEDALAYSRMRKEDPNGDFGRNTRQRQIIQAVIKEGASLSSITNFSDIFQALGTNIKTNLTFDEMVSIQKHYKSVAGNVQQMQMSGTGTMINSIYYLQISAEEQQRVQKELKAQLELDSATAQN
ncbi:LCP family protein [Bacillus sp. MRMR6]|uniref:LCP family glycopolymer transferase n=1 Tax=Bacillus sp. MRMR6 TaxID=1928617 RepID=UPI00095133FB|nr:LCP family protein [Bacillus sp. MRMR6]OLS41110.1 LytR family transcriptional regulator [Bacillus sp. MRMR6]